MNAIRLLAEALSILWGFPLKYKNRILHKLDLNENINHKLHNDKLAQLWSLKFPNVWIYTTRLITLQINSKDTHVPFKIRYHVKCRIPWVLTFQRLRTFSMLSTAFLPATEKMLNYNISFGSAIVQNFCQLFIQIETNPSPFFYVLVKYYEENQCWCMKFWEVHFILF